MKSKLYVKILAFCVVLSFIGIGIQPAFAVDTNPIASDENENPITNSGEILENTNCFVVGYATDITALVNKPYGAIKDVGFGGHSELGYDFVSEGFIRTRGLQGEWEYNGMFIGDNGERQALDPVDPGSRLTVYIGIRGFMGFGLLLSHILSLQRSVYNGMFIGIAKSVKIMTI